MFIKFTFSISLTFCLWVILSSGIWIVCPWRLIMCHLVLQFLHLFVFAELAWNRQMWSFRFESKEVLNNSPCLTILSATYFGFSHLSPQAGALASTLTLAYPQFYTVILCIKIIKVSTKVRGAISPLGWKVELCYFPHCVNVLHN